MHRPWAWPLKKQQLGNVYGVPGSGASQLAVRQAPVSAPLNGSKQGAHLLPAAQVDCSSDACPDTAGRQLDRHRPSAVVPAKAKQPGGSKFPAVEMMESGAQKLDPSLQCASCDCCAGGTYWAGRQWASVHAPPAHDGRIAGSITGGPVHGQVMCTGGSCGSSQPMLQAPVGVVPSPVSGS